MINPTESDTDSTLEHESSASPNDQRSANVRQRRQPDNVEGSVSPKPDVALPTQKRISSLVEKFKYVSSLSPVDMANLLYEFAEKWYKTRNWRAILAIIPPLTLLTVLGGFVLAGRLRSEQSLKTWYRDQASEMIGMKLDGATEVSEESLHKERSPEEDAKLDLFLKRVLQLGDENQEARYFVAISNLRQGKIAAARSMLESLAPVDRRGLDLAHAWLAEDLYRRSLQGEKIPIENLRHHLVNALERPRTTYSSLLYGLLAKIYEDEGNLDSAARVLSKYGEQDEKFVLEPILLFARRGMLRQATAEADSLIARENTKIIDPKTPHDEMVKAYLNTAKAYQLTNRIDATFPLLEQAIKLSPNNAELKRTLSDSYRVKFRASMTSDKQGQAQVGIELLSKAIEADPTNIGVQAELALLQQLGIASTEEKRVTLIRHIARQGASDAIRLLLAESALTRGDVTAAINEYEVVLVDKPNLTIALNNLAMLYAISKPPRFDEARQLIQKALEISPDTAEFYDTSGDIEDLAGNAQGAIEFYLLSIEGNPERLRTREKLVALYEKVGDKENAEKQKGLGRKIVERLKELNDRVQAQKDAQKQGEDISKNGPPPLMKQAQDAEAAKDADASDTLLPIDEEPSETTPDASGADNLRTENANKNSTDSGDNKKSTQP